MFREGEKKLALIFFCRSKNLMLSAFMLKNIILDSHQVLQIAFLGGVFSWPDLMFYLTKTRDLLLIELRPTLIFIFFLFDGHNLKSCLFLDGDPIIGWEY
jgi:hypothetical protein